ncbi:MAG: flagellar hook-basal body complex protein FliE [Pseudohongiellaceae bacterium]|jgi:flagellar hook-basal body complex protein FliE
MNSNAIQQSNELLSQIRAYQDRIGEQRPDGMAVADSAAIEKPFNTRMVEAMKTSIDQVNNLQANSADMIARYESGEDVPLTEVVLAMQKSSLAFEATVQVRNKVIKAYEDIMNMPV